MAEGILDLSITGASVPPAPNYQDELDKKVDKPLGKVAGSVAIVDATGNDLEYRKFLAKDIAVDTANMQVPTAENELGLNTNDNTLQKVVDKLDNYVKALVNDPDAGEAWIGGTTYPSKENFMITVTQTTAVDSAGNKLEQGKSYLMKYAGGSANNVASATLTLAEIARMELVAGGGGGTADKVEFDDTIAKLDAVAGTPVATVQKAIEVIKGIVDKAPHTKYVGTIAERDGILIPKKGTMTYVIDATADADVDAGWAVYIWTGTIWSKYLSKDELKHVTRLAEIQFTVSDPKYDKEGTISPKQLDRWFNTKEHPQTAVVQSMTADASLSKPNATFVTLEPISDNLTITVPAIDPAHNRARVLVNSTAFPIKVSQIGNGSRGLLPPYSTSLLDDSNLSRLPTDNNNTAHIHLTKALVAGVDPLVPTKAEITTALGANRKIFGYYTGTDAPTDAPIGVYHIDTDGHVLVVKSPKNETQKDIIFLTDAEITPAVGSHATTDEVKAYINTLTAKQKQDKLFFYTGSTIPTDTPKVVYESDKDGDLLLVDATTFPAPPSKITFFKNSDVNPLIAKKPTNAEIAVVAGAIKLRETVIAYNGTDVDNDKYTDLYYVDNYFDVVKLRGDSIRKYEYQFLSEADVNPAIVGKPTFAEIKIAMTAKAERHVFYFYTGTNTNTDEKIGIYHIDDNGDALELYRKRDKKLRVFIDKGTLAPADEEEPTLAELTAWLAGRTDILAFYTGTNIESDDVTRVYHVDDASNITVIYKKPKLSDKRDIILVTDVEITPIRAGKAKLSEMRAYLNTLTPKQRKNKLFIYTGTTNPNDRTKIVFAGDADGDITKTDLDILPEPTIFVKDTAINPALSLKPTELEIQQYCVNTQTVDTVIRYSGTEVSTDDIVRVFHVDKYMNVTLLRKEEFQLKDETVFIGVTALAPADPMKPTKLELSTFVQNQGIKSRHVYVTGTDNATDVVRSVYYADANSKLTMVDDLGMIRDLLEKERVHFTKTEVGAVDGDNPTLAEITNIATQKTVTNNIIYYTATDADTDKPTEVYHADKKGVITLLYKFHLVPPFPNKTVFLKESVVNPAIAGKPTVAEINTAITAGGTKDVIYTYNGTETTSDKLTGIYHMDTLNSITRFKDPSDTDLHVETVHLLDGDINPATASKATLAEVIAHIKTLPPTTRTNQMYTYTGTANVEDKARVVVFVPNDGVITTILDAQGSSTSGDYIATFDEIAGNNPTIPVNVGETIGDKVILPDDNEIWIKEAGGTYYKMDLSELVDFTLVEVKKTGNQYRWDRANSKFVLVKPKAEGLRGKPLADVTAIKAIEARDFEIRQDLSTKIIWKFTLGATPTVDGFADDLATGAWEIKRDGFITETLRLSTPTKDINMFLNKVKYPLNHTSIIVPNADCKITATKMDIYLNGSLTPAQTDVGIYDLLSTDIVFVASSSADKLDIYVTRTVVKPPKVLLFGGSKPNTAIRQTNIDGHIIAYFALSAPSATLVMENGYVTLPIGTYRISAVLSAKDMNSSDYCRVKLIDVGNNKKLLDSPTVSVVGGNDTMTVVSSADGKEEAYSKSINIIVKVTAETKLGLWLYQYGGGWTFNYEHSGISINQLPEETVVDASMQIAKPYTIKVTGDATTVNGGNASQGAYEDSGVVGVQIDTPTGKFIKKVIDQDGNDIAVADARSGVVYVNRTTGQGDITLTATLDNIPPIVGDLIAYVAQGAYDNATSSTLTFLGDPKAKGITHDTATGEFTALVDMIIDISLIDGIKSNFESATLELRMLDTNGKPSFVQEENSRDYRELKVATNDTWKQYKFDFSNFKILAGQKFALLCFVAGSGFDGGTFSQLTIKGIQI